MNNDDLWGSQMSFWDHLEDLRKMLFRVVALVAFFSAVFFVYMPDIFDAVILAPSRTGFVLYRWVNCIAKIYPVFPDCFTGDFQVKIININLASQFLIHMSATLWLAVIVSFPFLIAQVYVFVRPALYVHERKHVVWLFAFGNLLFYLGVCIAYFVIFPLTLRFLAGYQLSKYIENSVSLDSYIDSFMFICLVMGLVFELPVLSWMLSRVGVLRRSFFNRYRRHSIVVLLIVAAIITPTGDPFTLMAVFIPLYMLWEISAMVVRRD